MNLPCIGYTSWTSRVVLYVFCMIILHHRKYHFIRNIALGSKFVMYSLPLTKSLISCKSASIFLTDCSSSLDLFCVRKMLSLPKEHSHSQKRLNIELMHILQHLKLISNCPISEQKKEFVRLIFMVKIENRKQHFKLD